MDSNDNATTGNYFQDTSNPKLDEIKKLLEGDSISQKLDGMKRLIAMISKGRDVSSLFPNVVKNVVCEDVRVKQLVYMYLIHYAEFEQDTALLSISTFQKGLDNPNALIRAQALRVLTSIRLRVISNILILSVKRCVVDNSPYVRKTAAHAIPKIYSLDHSHKEELVECIETLFGDNSTLVLGSALAAFMEVCPDRHDLIHPHYRKFCNMIADVDEWGQIFMINVLVRYVRSQFANPNPEDEQGPVFGKRKKKTDAFYSDSESDESDDSEVYEVNTQEMDSDHRLFLRAISPLLQSRNTGVVIAVSMAYFYCAPRAEALKVGKALVRIVRSPPQIAFIVLENIKTMSQTRPEMFTPYLTEFFVYDNDPTFIQNLKLEILTNIALESNIARILREFNVYVRKESKEFVRATIQAIGKVASRLPEVQDSCMHGLMALITNRSEMVVAESVVVIKKLIQLSNSDETHVISHLAKLLDSISVPTARASIIWVAGEYNEKIPLLAPDILRKLAISFKKEDKIVKLQALNLATKLVLSCSDSDRQVVFLLFQYLCNMAKFDMNYDVRDRARIMRVMLLSNTTSTLSSNSKRLFCAAKPAPIEDVAVKDTFALNSLSHIVNHTAFGYLRVPDWPTEIPDPSTRNQVPRKQRRDMIGMGADTPFSPTSPTSPTTMSTPAGGFYSDEDSEYSDYSEESEFSDSDFSDDEPPSKAASKQSGAGDFFSGFSAPPTATTPSKPASKPAKKGKPTKAKPKLDAYGYPVSESEESESDFSDDEPAPKSSSQKSAAPAQQPADTFFGFSTPTAKLSSPQPAANNSPGLSGDLLSLNFDSGSDSSVGFGSSSGNFSIADPVRPRMELLKQVVGGGLKVEYQFLRRTSLHGSDFSPIQLWFINNSNNNLNNITVRAGKSDGGAKLIPIQEINFLPAHSSAEGLLNVKFESFTPIQMQIVHSSGSHNVELSPPAGELITQHHISPGQFSEMQKKLGGFQEVSGIVNVKAVDSIPQKIISGANLSIVTNDLPNVTFQFAGKTTIDNNVVLVSVDQQNGKTSLRVNCENAIFANTLHRELKKALEN